MRTKELRNEINKLEITEKLLLIEDVWNDIARSNTVLPLHEWQKQELDKRLQQYENDELKTKSWKEAHDELRKKYE